MYLDAVTRVDPISVELRRSPHTLMQASQKRFGTPHEISKTYAGAELTGAARAHRRLSGTSGPVDGHGKTTFA
jgi:hypothetical protein